MSYKEIYERWLTDKAVNEATKKELSGLPEKEIEDRFYKALEFGTGGLRGVMGAGTNRMNIYTVRQATQGLANEINSCGKEAAEKGVVIAFDSRNNSKEFAFECAKVLCANNIKTYLFDGLRPTPELSFAVRYLGCARGIVITASHNPKEYNGYKVYGEDGGQIPPETAEKIIGYINETDIFNDVKLTENPQFISIGEDIDKEYINEVKKNSFGIEIPEDLKIVYTPLHGSGNLLVRRVLKEIGINNLFVVPEQEAPNGDFPTVVSPNPENKEAFTIAIEYAKAQNADLVFGTDPDSDRIGVVVRSSDGEYMVLNGNQTGSLLCEYILRKIKESGKTLENQTVIKTIVTTEMVRAIADSFGAEVIDVLTGFKFIGEKIKEFEDAGEPERYAFGLEESYGYLRGTYARDKDAVVAGMLIAEMAAEYKSKGMTLYEGLLSLYEKYGYYIEELKTVTLPGLDGAEKISKMMEDLRKAPPKEIAGVKVTEVKDYKEGIEGLPKSNVIKLILENGWLAVRPSGTEPKIKFYCGVCEKTLENAKEKCNLIINNIM